MRYSPIPNGRLLTQSAAAGLVSYPGVPRLSGKSTAAGAADVVAHDALRHPRALWRLLASTIALVQLLWGTWRA